MEIIITTISLLIFIALVISPIIILKLVNKSKNKFKFITYVTIGLIVIAIISLIFGWWNDKSTIILLEHYNGYNINPDSNSGQVYYDAVLPENIDRVKELERSHMGIGWPLKSIFLFVLSSPYLLIVHFVIKLIDNNHHDSADL
ncbi:MAG: hypothetical protein RL259_1704 [Bacteroidota bacterium]|jgi:4-amino-4-deoxy-L-arabinose transferase-like glycosyltransferase